MHSNHFYWPRLHSHVSQKHTRLDTRGGLGRRTDKDRKAEILNGVFRSQSVTTERARRKWRGTEECTASGFKAVQVSELTAWNELQVCEAGSRSQEEVSHAQQETSTSKSHPDASGDSSINEGLMKCLEDLLLSLPPRTAKPFKQGPFILGLGTLSLPFLLQSFNQLCQHLNLPSLRLARLHLKAAVSRTTNTDLRWYSGASFSNQLLRDLHVFTTFCHESAFARTQRTPPR